MVLSNKTILIFIEQGFAARYLLSTDIFKDLKEAGLRIVIISPYTDDDNFQQKFADTRIILEKYDCSQDNAYARHSRFQSILEQTRIHVLAARGNRFSVELRRKLRRKKESDKTALKRGLFWLIDLSCRLLPYSKFLRRSLIWLESKLYSGSSHIALLKKYQPGMVIVTSLGYQGNDRYIMRQARRYGSQVLAIILSWDNTTAKGMAAASADRFIVWTDQMKQELVDGHDIPPEQIFVGGVAHFDFYYTDWSNHQKNMPVALEPERKVILFGTASPTRRHNFNLKIIRTLGDALQQNRFIKPCQVVVRIHPIYFSSKGGMERKQQYVEEISKLIKQYPHMLLNKPVLKTVNGQVDLTLDSMAELRGLLEQASVMVSMHSTLMLEASIKDVPNVIIAARPEWLKQPHVSRVLTTGGVRNSETGEDLINNINQYIEQPQLDGNGRKRIRKNECGPFPGSAGRVIAKHILELLAASSSSRK